MTRNTRIGPAPNLEDLQRNALKRAPEEDEGVTYDDELDAKRVLDESLGDRGPELPSERRRWPRAAGEGPIPQPPTDAQPPAVTGKDEDERE